MNLILAAGSLIGKLVAGEVQDFQTLILQILVHGFQGLIMGRKAAASGGIDDQQHLALVFGQADILALPVFHSEIVDSFHKSFSFRCSIFRARAACTTSDQGRQVHRNPRHSFDTIIFYKI